ncbi:MAG: PIN domain-containing protein [Planctomycetes bacterium]|nr:PIN domain-containing protein [Planctomycetota bacterium]
MLLVDAGPMVALLNADDDRHEDCVKALRPMREPLGTIWPAFTEAMHLLSPSWKAQNALWDRLASGVLVMLPLEADDQARMRDLMEKERDLPMDLTDAGLVRVAERLRIARVFTLDRRDFERYRPRGIGHFTIVP